MTSPARGPQPDEEAGPFPGQPGDPVGPMTFEEYLAFEEASEIRHEFVGGYAYPYPLDVPTMNGGTHAHHAIIVNVIARLRALTRGTPCWTLSQGFKLLTPSGNAYYPDVVVSCGPKPPNDALYLDDPCLAVEVLSPSTRRNDLGDKRDRYVEAPSLNTYLVVESTWRAVHRHWRDADGTWREETVGRDAKVALPCPAGGVLTLDEIYEDVDLPDEPPRARLRRVKEAAAEAYAAE